MAEHTKGELRAEGIYLTKDGRTFARMHTGPGPSYSAGVEEKANAARLALCWNCHDDLVAALDQLLHETVEAGFATAEDYGWPKSIADARAALAKARGEA